MNGHITNLILIFAISVNHAVAKTPSEIFSMNKDSVVIVLSLDKKGEPNGFGSGIYLPNGKIATNCHVLENADTVSIKFNDKFYSADLYGGDVDEDLCLLTSRIPAKPATVAPASTIRVGDPVYAIGAPRGLELSLSDGIVSALRGTNPPSIQTTAAISKGSSGGGLFNANGHLIGITTLYIDDGQNLNFALSTDLIPAIRPISKSRTANLATNTGNVEQLERQTKTLFENQEYIGSTRVALKWHQIQPKNPLPLEYLGRSYLLLKDYELSVKYYAMAVTLEPNKAEIVAGFGYALYFVDKKDDALTLLNEAVRMDPQDHVSYNVIGNIYLESSKYKEAVKAFESAVAIEPKDADYWINLAEAYEMSGASEAKINTSIQLAYRADPNNIDAINKYAEIIAESEPIKAFPMIQKVLNERPNDYGALFTRGFIYLKTSRYQEAITDFQRVLGIKKDYYYAYYNLALAYNLSDQHYDAYLAYEQFKKYNPQKAKELYELIKP
jgi:cytochrome c-type biogenesis protein CcmH/NrfG